MKDEVTVKNLIKAMDRVYSAEQSDITCQAAAVFMAQIVDQDSREQGLELSAQFPELFRHLKVCTDCAAEYQILLSFAEAVADESGSPITVPARPDRKNLFETALAAVDKLINFPGFGRLATGPVRGGNLDVAPAEIDLGGGFLLEIDLALNPKNSALRDIFVSVQAGDEMSDIELEGVSVSLAEVGEHEQIATAMLDRYGEALLPAVAPDIFYFLQIELNSIVSRVQYIKLP